MTQDIFDEWCENCGKIIRVLNFLAVGHQFKHDYFECIHCHGNHVPKYEQMVDWDKIVDKSRSHEEIVAFHEMVTQLTKEEYEKAVAHKLG